MTPPPLPWWRDWTLYDAWARDQHGTATHYLVFLTGLLFCLFSLRMRVSGNSEYVTLSADDFGGRRLADVPPDEVVRTLEGKRRRKDPPD